MPSPASSPPLAVAVLAALWVSVGRCGVSGSPGPGCDNGKFFLDRDLPADAGYWACSGSTWPESPQRHPGIDTVYDPNPARQICMDKTITYNHTVPSSGAYRPVRAESGEYVYCPPQRWLNNMHHGATVLLYHPCAPLRERLLLSALARSCLSDYIITPHPQLDKHTPIALVSWGRTLELSSVDPSDVCDWLETTVAARNNFRGVDGVRKYNLLLTQPAEHPEGRSANTKESLRQCCEQTISSLRSEGAEAELNSSMEEKKAGKRQRRAAIRGKQTAQDASEKDDSLALRGTDKVQDYNNTLGPSEDPTNRTFSDLPGQKEAHSQSETQNRTLGSDTSTAKGDPLAFGASESQKSRQTIQAAVLQLSPKHTDPKTTNPSADVDTPADGVNGEHNHTERPEAQALSSKGDGTDSVKQSGKASAKQNYSKEKTYKKDVPADGKMKDNEVVDVKERELEHKQTHGATHSPHKSENKGFDSVSNSRSESPPHPQRHPNPQPAVYLPSGPDCDSCAEGERCDCTREEARAAVMNKGLPRTPRTDEAMWAAAALGFLLVLLTLSVLHTRLYRHWRTTPSLYWHDPRQDYDSVADVIRRRLRIAKRRRKRGRRQECVLLPSSSSSDEFP